MRLTAPIYKLKRQARLLARDRDIPLHAALDEMARREGFRSWSHLASAPVTRPAAQILSRLDPGDLLLIGGRPGHGKTLLGLELAAVASRARNAFVFTLDYTEQDVADRLAELGQSRNGMVIDTSDVISADYIVSRLEEAGGPSFALVDYLQLLDQRRTAPELDQQVAVLADYARRTGAIIAVISQIDRRFEAQGAPMPTLSDIRLPNPCDLGRFTGTCFLHDGEIRFDRAA